MSKILISEIFPRRESLCPTPIATLFQRLHVGPLDGFDPPILPNLQNISLEGNLFWGSQESPLFHAFNRWAMPRLDSLTLPLNLPRRWSPGAAFIHFLQTQGPLLLDLTLKGRVGGCSSPLSDIISLCSNLRWLVVVSGDYIDLLSFPPLPKLEILNIVDFRCIGGSDDAYLNQFDELVSSWQIRLPNLRFAKLKGPETSTVLRMLFCTEDMFYTVEHGMGSCKRWRRKWIGASTLGVSAEDSADTTALYSVFTQIHLTRFRRTPGMVMTRTRIPDRTRNWRG
jgi:hypothetical protein